MLRHSYLLKLSQTTTHILYLVLSLGIFPSSIVTILRAFFITRASGRKNKGNVLFSIERFHDIKKRFC